MVDAETVVMATAREILPEKAAEIRPEVSLKDLKLDSLDMLEVKMRLEEKLNIDLEADIFTATTTLRDLARHIAAALRQNSDAGP